MANEFHWYGSTVEYWHTAATREEVIKRLAKITSKSMFKAFEKPGIAMNLCRVELPQAAHYSISNYMPNKIVKEDGVNETRKGELVPLTETEYLRLLDAKGKTIPNVD
jgi:hypothetical protein